MPRRDLVVGIAGAGGDGVVSAGELVLNIAAQQGLFGMLVKSFGPQIRGGESTVRLRLSTAPVLSQGDELDVLIAFNWTDYGRFRSELVPNEATADHFDELKKHFDAGQIVEIVATIALFGYLNRWNDTMATTLETRAVEVAQRAISAVGWQAGKHEA